MLIISQSEVVGVERDMGVEGGVRVWKGKGKVCKISGVNVFLHEVFLLYPVLTGQLAHLLFLSFSFDFQLILIIVSSECEFALRW